MEICGVILAGGRSKRFGKDKALLNIGGTYVINRLANLLEECFFKAVVVVKNKEQHLKVEKIIDNPHIKILEDNCEIFSPIAGLSGILNAVEEKFIFVVACDMPLVNKRVISRIISELDESVDCIVPIFENRLEPLCAVYRKNIFQNRNFEESMHSVIDGCNCTKKITFSDPADFLNINTVENLKEVKPQSALEANLHTQHITAQ
ncbi:MAG: molybdenum cofactor guanylyltransferase [Candidatus Aenigmarchaeota archaeon]|nr:molybdenum cofactor guanylyltransferase [Candidatus Aenigmarchaeota archaeon]